MHPEPTGAHTHAKANRSTARTSDGIWICAPVQGVGGRFYETSLCLCAWHVYRAPQRAHTHSHRSIWIEGGAGARESYSPVNVCVADCDARRDRRESSKTVERRGGLPSRHGNAARSLPPYTEAHVLTSVSSANWRMSANIVTVCR